jgi:hypothetical protein
LSRRGRNDNTDPENNAMITIGFADLSRQDKIKLMLGWGIPPGEVAGSLGISRQWMYKLKRDYSKGDGKRRRINLKPGVIK